MSRFVVPMLTLVVVASGCNLFTETALSSDDAGTPDGSMALQDANTADDGGSGSDSGVDGGDCQPETPEQLCTRLGHECGALAASDLCGFERAVSCGGCDPPEECGAVTPNQCDCAAEDDVTFCQRLGRDCGAVTDVDNCGADRTADCGMCAGGEACGEQTPNVCGCPCLVDGTCRPVGAANPTNPCEVCDPTASVTAWTITEGAMCDDRNLCTVNTTCSATGQCTGASVDCSNLTTDCRAGACDPSAGCFAVDLADGVGCTSDGDDCTVDTCTAGNCAHTLAAGECVIAGTCHNDGTANPANPCEICDVATSSTAWSAEDGGGCADGDGLSCTSGVCSARSCVSAIDPGFCVVASTCINVGTINPADDCEVCAPAVSATAWSPAPDGIACVAASGGCSVGSCLGGVCSGSAGSGCAIALACWPEGVLNPANDCQYCDPSASATSWSALPSGTTCSDGDPFHCTFGACDGTGSCELAFDSDFCVDTVEEICVRGGEGIGGLDCVVCDATVDNFAPAADGTACDTEDNLACTSGSCSDGWCQAVPDAGFCAIGGACYANGAVNPADACKRCDAATSQTDWTAQPNGTACGAGLMCMSGDCGASACGSPLPADRCLINGVCYAPGQPSPTNPCLVCDPNTSQGAFTESSGSCDPGVQCASSGFCGALAAGVCLPLPDPDWCVISGVCYQSGDVNPAASCEVCAPESLPIAWWPRDGFCSVDGQCAADGQTKPGSACEICDANNPLTWSVRPSSCNIAGICYNAGDSQPGNPCRVCSPGKAQTQWSDAPNSTFCGGTACTCHNGSCDTSGGC